MFNARNGGPLYLAGVEAHHQPGPYRALIADAKSRGAEYSKIWDLFAFKNEFTVHLARFSHGVMRLPATISPGLREPMAAYTSYQRCRRRAPAVRRPGRRGDLLRHHDLCAFQLL